MAKLNKLKAEAIVNEFTELHGADAIKKLQNKQKQKIDFTFDLFDRQKDFIEDPSKRKAILAGRRSGKSHCIAYYLVKICYEQPGAMCAFVGISQKSARQIIWPYIEDINHRYKLNAEPNLGNLTWTFPNGSQIMITGADNAAETRKHLGKHYSLVVIDECGEFKAHLKTFVKKTLMPTLIDYDGTLCMIGTPGDICAGFWYEVSTRKLKAWSVYDGWNITNNPKLPKWSGQANWKVLAEAELKRIKEEEGYDDLSPQYIRQYIGEWHEGGSAMIYGHFNYSENTYRMLPDDLDPRYLMGIDYGIKDASAIVIAAFSPYTNKLYITEVYKQNDIAPEDMADQVKFYFDKYRPVAALADGQGIGAAFIKQLRKQYDLPVQLAEKKDKVAFIELLNDDFRLRKIKIHVDCEDLLLEIAKYQWADSELKILPDIANDHCLDALLYLWRHSLHHKGQSAKPKPVLGDPDYEDYLVEIELERVERESKMKSWERIENELYGS